MVFLRRAYLIFYCGTTLFIQVKKNTIFIHIQLDNCSFVLLDICPLKIAGAVVSADTCLSIPLGRNNVGSLTQNNEGTHMDTRTTHVIVVGNQKGGVGKTTNTINIAAALSELGRTSLIIDLDMTAGATKSLGAPTEGWISSFELLTGAEDAEGTIIGDNERKVALPPNIHLVPSSRKLAELDTFLASNPWVTHQDLLLKPIRRLRGRYDYIFLDTPPQVTKTTVPALKAADFAILSTMPDHLAIAGIADALRDIATAKKYGNPRLVLLAVIVCAIPQPKTRLARQLIQYVEQSCIGPDEQSLKFKTEITRTVVIQEAQRLAKTIFQYDPSHLVADQYRTVALELEERIVLLSNDRHQESYPCLRSRLKTSPIIPLKPTLLVTPLQAVRPLADGQDHSSHILPKLPWEGDH